MRNETRTADATVILNRHFGDEPERRAEIEQVKQEMAIGIHSGVIRGYRARKASGLTQQQLAERVGTTQSVISALESANYEGHSMPMLRRIAAALGRTVRVSLVKTGTDAPMR